ncbi:hypothetical protein JSY36_04685 [Bacillus sp. H-16]|uniref:hypothetical protein n=1 Tax=Alteribacter salitolerans TaxID=2912333 RepID=UPI00196484BC|nr:hypothetical protein [Alteribacter salitolerans]MBM7095048.1 hypothetical protein [Alteribacter salitolerans]
MLTKLYVKADTKLNEVKNTLEEERGALSLEWVALGLLVIVVISGVMMAFSDDQTFGNAIRARLTEFINQIGQ